MYYHIMVIVVLDMLTLKYITEDEKFHVLFGIIDDLWFNFIYEKIASREIKNEPTSFMVSRVLQPSNLLF